MRPGGSPRHAIARRLALAAFVAAATVVVLGLRGRLAGEGPGHEGASAEHAAAAATAAPEGAAHGGAGAEGGGVELPNLITIVHERLGDRGWVRVLVRFENVFFAWLAVLVLGLAVYAVFRRRAEQPGKLQGLLEIAVEGLDNLVCGLLGPRGRRYTPFLGTLFIYILFMNLMGLVPFLKSPTSSINTTAALAICVFIYVQADAVRNLGFGGYVHHLAGEPRDLTTWLLVPLMLPLHIISELARPLTLALRLFGNITGEDILLAAFVGLGAATLHFTGLPVGLPIQVPLYFLAMLTSVIQALVFTLLSAVYFLLVQPHEEEGH